MILFLTTETFDEQGDIRLIYSDGSKMTNITRRVTKTATLDGGSTLTDLGHSASDLDMVINVDELSDGDYARLRRLVRTYPVLNLSCLEGFFKGAIVYLSADRVPLTFTFSVRERIDG